MKERVERWDRDTLAKSAKYVGRKSEWELLDSYLKKNFERAETTPVPVIGIRADGGMGKSRMAYEYLNHGSCPRGLMLKGKAISYTAAPYWIFISLMKNMLEVSEGDSIEKIKAKWDALVGRLAAFSALPESERANASATLKENEDYLAYLLGVARDPEQIRSIKPDKLKELIFNSFRVFLDAAASLPENDQAFYLVFDDMHWIDELSRELIDYLMQNLRPACKVLILAMFRPDYQGSSFWQKDKNYFEISLEPLAVEETTVMVEGMLRGLVLTENLKNLIYEKSGGNPFYVEEITYALVDRGVLIPDEEIQPGNRIWVVNPTEPSIELPDSIHGMVQTRIDKLEENERTLLYEASVIGMEFNTDLLTSLHAKAGGKSDHLEKTLEVLETARLMNEKIAQITPEGNYKKGYIFSNALVLEVAYNTLLNYNKQLLHGLLGECIEEIYSQNRIPEDEHHRLAYHFEKGDKADKAITYLESSADQCATRFSNKAAIDCYSRLLKMLGKSSRPKDEVDEITMRNLYNLAQIEYRINSLDEAYGHYAECSKICQERKNYDLLCRVLTRAGEIERIREKQDKAMRFFEKSLELAEKMGHDFYVADNLANIGIVLEERGDYAGAMQYFQKALGRATTDEQRQDISHYIFHRT
jgi:predicted ATPase